MKNYKLTATIFLLVIFLLNFNQHTKAQPGTLDPGFGAGGVVPTLTMPNQQNNALTDAALQADGKLVVAGGIIYRYGTSLDLNRFLLVRYKTDGTLDPEFGTNGVSAIPLGNSAAVYSVSILPDGKILAVGSFYDGPANLVLARYHPNGSLDTSFGTNGVTVNDFALPGEYSSEYPVESFVLPDNKILVVGKKLSVSTISFKRASSIPIFSVFIARYNADGSPDMTFGEFGRLLLNSNLSYGTMDSVTMQADGKILVSDRNYKGSEMVSQITRYNPDGSVDAGFAQNGVLRFPPADEANRTKILPNGKILVLLRYNLMLFNADGSFDRNIFSEPVLINGKEFFPFQFDLQTDGKIVALGLVNLYTLGGPKHVAVARFHADGRIDTTFGESGIFYRITNSPGQMNQILIQPDGKIIGVRGQDYVSPDTAIFRLLGGSSVTDSR